MRYIKIVGLSLLAWTLVGPLVAAADRPEVLLERAEQLEREARLKDALAPGEFSEMIELAVELGKPSLLDACLGKAGQVVNAGEILRTIYTRHGDQMWRHDLPVPLMGSYIALAQDLNADRILAELVKDIGKFKPWTLDDPQSPWEREQKHPSRSALAALVNWQAKKHGTEGVRSLYDAAATEARLDVVSGIIGGYLPDKQDQLAAAKLFLAITEDMTRRGHGDWIKGEIRSHARWLEAEVYKPLRKLKDIYAPEAPAE